MGTAHYTPEADRDLTWLAAYIARDNVPAAIRWLDAMEAVCNLIGAQPRLGQRVSTRRFGKVHRHVAGNYVIYYRPLADGVEILAVVHGARDQEKLL